MKKQNMPFGLGGQPRKEAGIVGTPAMKKGVTAAMKLSANDEGRGHRNVDK